MPSGKTALISIIDDDQSVLAAADLLISSLGFETCAFSSAEEFLQSVRLDDTACLLSDVHMPHISGIELQRVLRAQGRNIPTIFMTAFSNEKIKARAIAGGAVCFLIKPFDSKTLISCINAALGRRQSG
jgi:FixJ family two-component response regulator